MYTFQKVNSVCNYSVRSKKKYSYVFPSSTFVSHLVTGCGCNWETSGTIRSTDCSSAGKVSPHGPTVFLFSFSICFIYFLYFCVFIHSFALSFFLSLYTRWSLAVSANRKHLELTAKEQIYWLLLEIT